MKYEILWVGVCLLYVLKGTLCIVLYEYTIFLFVFMSYIFFL